MKNVARLTASMTNTLTTTKEMIRARFGSPTGVRLSGSFNPLSVDILSVEAIIGSQTRKIAFNVYNMKYIHVDMNMYYHHTMHTICPKYITHT